MQKKETKDPFSSLIPLMNSKGVTISPKDFQECVNVIFHDIEAQHYDSLHAEMWASLPYYFGILSDDVTRSLRTPPENGLRVLDLGCGTGLISQCLMGSSLGSWVGNITLIDTSTKMLDACKNRSHEWGIPTNFVHGSIECAPQNSFDLVMISSVLHHIPDIGQFLGKVASALAPGGHLIHLQDPNGDVVIVKNESTKNDRRLFIKPSKLNFQHIRKRIRSLVYRLQGTQQRNYLDDVNDELLKKGIVKKRLSGPEIWSVTDIQLDSLPYSTGSGIHVDQIAASLPHCVLISKRSYAFFGKLLSELDQSEQLIEKQRYEMASLKGRLLAGIWRKES